MANFNISYKIYIKDNFSAPIKKIKRDTDRFKNSVNSLQSRLSRLSKVSDYAARRMANFRTAIGTVGTWGMLKKVVSTSYDFELTLNKIRGLLTKSTKPVALLNKEMSMLEKESMKVGETTIFTSSQILEGYRKVLIAGKSAQQAIDLVSGSAKLATAADYDLGKATEKITDYLNVFEMELNQSSYASDLLASSVNSSSQNIYEMMSALKNVGSEAKFAGFDMKETTIWLMALADKALKGGSAGTKFKNLLLELGAPQDKLINNLKKLNVNLDDFKDSTGKVDLYGLINQVNKADVTGKKLKDTLGKAFNKRSYAAFVKLLGMTKEQWNRYNEAQNKVAGYSQKLSDIMMQGLPGGLKRAEAAIEGLTRMLGKVLMPEIIGVFEIFTEYVNELKNSSPEFLKIIMKVVAFTAVLAPFAIALGIIAALFSSTTTIAVGLMFILGKLKFVVLLLSKTILGPLAAAFVKFIYINGSLIVSLLANPLFWIPIAIGLVIAAISRLILKWKELKASFASGGVFGALKTFFGFGSADVNINKTAENTAINKGARTSTNVNMKGEVWARAEKGTEITKKKFTLNTGFQDIDMLGV